MVCVWLTSEMERILCLLFLHRVCIAKYTKQGQLKICHSRSQQSTCCAMWPKITGLWSKMAQSVSWCLRRTADRSLEIIFGVDLLNYYEAGVSSLAVNPPHKPHASWHRSWDCSAISVSAPSSLGQAHGSPVFLQGTGASQLPPSQRFAQGNWVMWAAAYP